MIDQEITQLGAEVAKHLDGWTFEEDVDKDNANLVKDGMKFSIRRDWHGKRDHVNIQTWAWPTYKRMERGQEKYEIISPSSLYDPKEDSPSISVAVARGAEAIAKEIKRRFLPEYERIYARCLERAASYQQHENNARDGWEEICKVIGKSPNGNMYYVSAGGDLNATIENNSGSFSLKVRVNAEQVKAVLAALKAVKG